MKHSHVSSLFAALVVLLPAILAASSQGLSQYSIHVVLWNESAEGIGVGGKFNASAQVYINDQPANATAVTFRLGLDFPPFAYAVNYTGVYAGSPGLYRAELTLTAMDITFVVTPLEVIAENGTEVAVAQRSVITINPSQPPPGQEWTIAAGLENFAEIGTHARPGDTLVFRVQTMQDGVLTDAPSLNTSITVGVDFNALITLMFVTPTRVGPGEYLVPYQVPSNLTESRIVQLNAVISENNSAFARAEADVWMYDTFAHFLDMDLTALRGNLFVGDGIDPVGGLDVDLAVYEDFNPTNVLGSISGTTNPFGAITFFVANSGTQYIHVDGWINGTLSQRIDRAFEISGYQGPPMTDTSRLDAVPYTDASAVPWSGEQTFSFLMFDNGSMMNLDPVLVFVGSARGLWQGGTLYTTAAGFLDVTLNFTAAPAFAFDDAVNGGLIFTFRVPQGPDASSSDGQWWGEDQEFVTPDFTASFLEGLVDTNISLTTQTITRGQPFGVASRYDGSANHTSWVSATTVVPGGLSAITGAPPGPDQVWSSQDMPMVSYMAPSAQVGHFFGCSMIPSYWPDIDYTLLNVQLPSFTSLGSSGLGPDVALAFRTVSEGSTLGEFTPGPDTLDPQVYAAATFQGAAGSPIALVAYAYDDSIDFCQGGNYTWTVQGPSGTIVANGSAASVTINAPGTYDGTVTVYDTSGNHFGVDFQVVVVDLAQPTANAGADFSAITGQLVAFDGTNSSDDDPSFPSGAVFEWSFTYNGSIEVITGVNPTFTFWVAGSYTVTLSVWDAAGNTASDSVVVTVTPWDIIAPTVEAGAAVSGFTDANITVAGTASDNDPGFGIGGQVWWTFDFNAVAYNLSGAALDFGFTLPGSYTLTLWARDPAGNTANDTVVVTIALPDLTAPTITPIADKTVDEDVMVHFEATATDNAANFSTVGVFRWTFTEGGLPVTLTGSDAHHTFASAGNITVTLTVTDGSANAASITFMVRVRERDTAPPVIQVTSSTVRIAAGGTATLSATATDAGTALTNDSAFVWTFTYAGAAVNLTGRTVSYKFDQAGTYNVTLTVTDAAGNRQTSNSQVVVESAPASGTFDPLIIVLLVLVLAGVAGAVIMMKRKGPGGESDASAGGGAAGSDKSAGGESDASAGGGSAGSDKRTGGGGGGSGGGAAP